MDAESICDANAGAEALKSAFEYTELGRSLALLTPWRKDPKEEVSPPWSNDSGGNSELGLAELVPDEADCVR